MTCDLIANELNVHIRSLPAHERFAILSINALPAQVGQRVGKAYIRRVPCRLVDLTVLKIEVNLSVASSEVDEFWPQFSRVPSLFAMIFSSKFDHLSFLLNHLMRPSSSLGKAHALREVQVHIRLTMEEKVVRTTYHDKLARKILSDTKEDIKRALSRCRMSVRNDNKRLRIQELSVAFGTTVNTT